VIPGFSPNRIRGDSDVLAGAFAYSFLVAFVLSCVRKNRRENRPGTPMLRLVGLALMSGSFAMAGLLMALAFVRHAMV
jgi:hypothetical protein